MAPTRPARTKAQYANQRLDRSSAGILDRVTGLVGIYSTAPTSHLALIARLNDYTPTDLDRLVLEERSLVRMGAMRGSGYYIPAALVPIVVGATQARRSRVFSDIVGKMMDRRTYDRLAAKIEAALSGTEMTAAELRKTIGARTQAGNVRYVVALMATECRIVPTRTKGTWRSNLTGYALWSEWLPNLDPWSVTPEEALPALARLYFEAHGPATVQDFAWWSGVKQGAADIVSACGVAELEDGYYGSDLQAPPATGVRLLPIWDGTFLSHKDRSHVVSDDSYRYVYDASGNPTSIILVNGRAAGQWDLSIERSLRTVKVAPFDSFGASTWKKIEIEVERLGAALGAPDIQIVRVEKPTALDEAEWNRFMSPLKEA